MHGKNWCMEKELLIGWLSGYRIIQKTLHAVVSLGGAGSKQRAFWPFSFHKLVQAVPDT